MLGMHKGLECDSKLTGRRRGRFRKKRRKEGEKEREERQEGGEKKENTGKQLCRLI